MAWSDALKDWSGTLLELVFPEPSFDDDLPSPIEPPFWEHCGERFSGAITTAFRCSNCQERTWHFEWARALYPSEGAVRDAIHAFKYRHQFHQRRHLVKWLCGAFDRHATPTGITWDALVPVPLHTLRRRERGFNQAYELARGLSKFRHIPVTNCLQRLHDTGTQTKLSRDERWRNLRAAFELRRGFDVRGRNLLLIDDVFTTGATCEGCARVLRKEGAHLVGVLTVARG